LVENTRTIGVDRLLLGVERCRGLAALAEADPATAAGAEVVVDHQVLAVGRAVVLQRLEAQRHADEPAKAADARVHPRQRHGADDLSDAHGRPAPAGYTPGRAGTPPGPARTGREGSAGSRRTSAPASRRRRGSARASARRGPPGPP